MSVIIFVIKQIGIPVTRSSDFVTHSYDYRPNWTPLSPFTNVSTVDHCSSVVESLTGVIQHSTPAGRIGNFFPNSECL